MEKRNNLQKRLDGKWASLRIRSGAQWGGTSFLLQILVLNTAGLASAFDVSAPRPLDWAFATFFHSDGFHHSEDCEVDCLPQTEGSWKDFYLRPGKNALKVTEKRAEDLKHDVHES
jgi:hypothetical protein